MSHDHSHIEDLLLELSIRSAIAQERFVANLSKLPTEERDSWVVAQRIERSRRMLPLLTNKERRILRKRFNVEKSKPTGNEPFDRLIGKMRAKAAQTDERAREIVASLNGMTVEQALEKRVSKIS